MLAFSLTDGVFRRPQGEATGKSSPPAVWNFVEGRGWPGSCGLIEAQFESVWPDDVLL